MLDWVNIFQIHLTREMLNQLCMNQVTMHAHENQSLNILVSKNNICTGTLLNYKLA